MTSFFKKSFNNIAVMLEKWASSDNDVSIV